MGQLRSALRAYASERGVRLIGDVAIYVAPGSADHRAHPELFQERFEQMVANITKVVRGKDDVIVDPARSAIVSNGMYPDWIVTVA